MKNFLTIFVLSIFISCGSKEEKKKGFEYNRTQKEVKKTTATEGSKISPFQLGSSLAKGSRAKRE